MMIALTRLLLARLHVPSWNRKLCMPRTLVNMCSHLFEGLLRRLNSSHAICPMFDQIYLLKAPPVSLSKEVEVEPFA